MICLNDYLRKCIDNTKKIFLEQINNDYFYLSYSEYSKPYFWTNEDINTVYNLIDLDIVNSCLSVLSSGDHVFNLITNGVLDIDSFDINKLCEFYALGFKRAMILKNNYSDFKDKMNSIGEYSTSQVYDLISDLFQYMDSDHVLYWKELLDFSISLDLNKNIFKLLTRYNTSSFCESNYLINEDNYNNLRSNIGKANISFNYCDVYELNSVFHDKYDLIILSNILDYASGVWGIEWNYRDLRRFERMLKKLLNRKGLILLHYIFNNYDHPNLILSSDVKKKQLKKEKIISFNSFDNRQSGIVTLKK